MEIRRAATVLQIPPDRLEHDRVVAAWRRFARTNHPDVCPGDPTAADRFHAGRTAYEALIAAVPATRPAPRPAGGSPHTREWWA